ncbi:MAG: hypothetical protein ACE5GI_09025 [Candidatus Aminicenantales bacterium]
MSRKLTLIFLIILLIIFSSRGNDNIAYLEEETKAIFGAAINNGPGMIRFSLSEEGISIHYRLFPEPEIYINEVIGHELTQKIRIYYKKIKRADKITFLILLPSQDAWGKRRWNPYLYFTTTRKLFDQIDWCNFQDKKLLEIAENIKYIR